MARVIVVGATGHVGNVVTRALLREGHEVVAAARDPNARSLNDVDVERAIVDVLAPATLEPALRDADAVIFAAGQAAVGPHVTPVALQVHAEGAPNVARATLEVGARFVFVSSAVIFDPPGDGAPIDEGAPHRVPRTGYEGAKITAEHALDALEDDSMVRLYPSGILGPYDFGPSPLGNGLRLYWRRVLPAVVRGAFDFVDVRDVADAIVQAATRPDVNGRYLLTGQTLTAAELFGAAAALYGRSKPPALPWRLARGIATGVDALSLVTGVHFPFTRDAVVVLDDTPVFECARARADLGYAPRDVRAETLPDLRAFFVREGVLRS